MMVISRLESWQFYLISAFEKKNTKNYLFLFFIEYNRSRSIYNIELNRWNDILNNKLNLKTFFFIYFTG